MSILRELAPGEEMFLRADHPSAVIRLTNQAGDILAFAKAPGKKEWSLAITTALVLDSIHLNEPISKEEYYS